MITWNWFDTDCKSEWAIFTRLITRLISLAGPFWLQEISVLRAMHYGNIFLMILKKLNTMQCVLSIIQYSEADFLSVYVL